MVIKSSNRVTWLDTSNISQLELKSLAKKELKPYKIHQLIFKELLVPSARSKVERYGNYIYLVMHFPFYNIRKQTSEPYEVDFILTKDKILTNRYGPFEPLDKFSEKVRDKNASQIYLAGSPAQTLYYLMEEVFTYLLRELHHISEKISEVEAKVLQDNPTQKFVKEILYVKRDILDFRRLVIQMKPILDSFKPRLIEFFGENSAIFADAILAGYFKIQDAIEGHKDTVESLEQTHTSMLNLSLARTMKSFTVMAFMTFPLVLLVSILGLTSVGNPLSQIPYAFYWIVGAVIVLLLTMFAYFKNKHWL